MLVGFASSFFFSFPFSFFLFFFFAFVVWLVNFDFCGEMDHSSHFNLARKMRILIRRDEDGSSDRGLVEWLLIEMQGVVLPRHGKDLASFPFGDIKIKGKVCMCACVCV